MLQVLRNEILPLIVPSTGSRLRKIERIPIVAWTRRRDRIRSHLTLQILPVYRFRPIVDLFLWHFLKFERTLASTPRRGRKYRRRNVELNLTDAEILRRFHIKVQGKNWSPCRNACLVLKSSTGLNLYFSSCRRNGIYICLKKKKNDLFDEDRCWNSGTLCYIDLVFVFEKVLWSVKIWKLGFMMCDYVNNKYLYSNICIYVSLHYYTYF